MDNLRKGFPVLKRYTYLNTAASGLLPEEVFEFRQEHDLDFLISASVLKEKQGELLTDVRETVGRFFNCEANRVALVPNFSYGFNTLLEGFEKSKKALLLKDDYPSINWPVKSRNFEIVYAEIDANVEDNIRQALAEHQPDFFAFSIVQYISGVKLEIDFLNELKQEFPETLFIADGTQYLGTENFDFDATSIDVLISSAYKWLNGGYGNGFMLFSENIEGKVEPKHLGFGSLQGKYKAHEGNFLGKFEPGHQDTLNYGSLAIALRLLEKTGMDAIEAQVNKLKTIAKEKFAELDLLESFVLQRKQHSSLFNIKGDDALFHHLRQKDIITSQRGEGIRVSLHFFNTEAEIEALITAIKERS